MVQGKYYTRQELNKLQQKRINARATARAAEEEKKKIYFNPATGERQATKPQNPYLAEMDAFRKEAAAAKAYKNQGGSGYYKGVKLGTYNVTNDDLKVVQNYKAYENAIARQQDFGTALKEKKEYYKRKQRRDNEIKARNEQKEKESEQETVKTFFESRAEAYKRKFEQGQINKRRLQDIRSGRLTRQTSAQEARVYAGSGGSVRVSRDTPTTELVPGVEYGVSERTGRSFIIREGGTGQNERILRIAQGGGDLSTPSSSDRFYMAATSSTGRRSAGFQYQPPVRATGIQSIDQPSPVNFPAYQRANTGSEIKVDVPLYQRPGGQKVSRAGGLIQLQTYNLSDYERSQRRLGQAIVPSELASGKNTPYDFVRDKVAGVLGRDDEVGAVTPVSGFRRDLSAGVFTRIRDKPVNTAALLVAGYGLGAVTTAVSASTVIGGTALRSATLFGGTYYLGSVGAAAAYSGRPGYVLGYEAPGAASFGIGYYLGSGSNALLSRRGVTPPEPPPPRLGGRNIRNPGRNELITDFGGEPVAFRVGRGYRGTTSQLLRERGLSPTIGQRIGSFTQRALSPFRSRRGQTNTVLENPLTRLRSPRTRSRRRPDSRSTRTPFLATAPRLSPSRAISGSRYAPMINRFRFGITPFNSTSSAFNNITTPLTDVGTGSRFKPAFDLGSLAIGGALLFGLTTGVTGGKGGGGGGFGLGGGGGGFGRGFGFGRGAKAGRSQYTPSWAALELGYTRRGRAPTGRVFSGFGIRPVFRGGL